MAPEPLAGEEPLIVYVLFMDIVGSTRETSDSQKAANARLTKIVSSTREFQESRSNGGLISLPTGDGMALVFLRKMEAPLRCAVEIVQALRVDPFCKLRMGIHAGPVFVGEDINGKMNVSGAGINLAERVMSCGASGHILLSASTAESLRHLTAWRNKLRDLGEFRAKRDTVHIWNFIDGDVGSAEPLPALSLSSVRLRRRVLVSLIALVLAVLSGLAFLPGSLEELRTKRLPDRKHLAILPFRNISKNANDDLFCEGLMGTLSSKLSQFERYQKSFWVVPALDTRMVTDSESAYRRLGATVIVSGTFERLPKKNRLILSLVDVRDHRQLDSRMLETPSADLSNLENEAWLRVADMLDLQLDPKIVQSIEAGKSKVPGAYEYYEQGMGYMHRNGVDNLKQAVWLFQESASRDPSYALAYAGLGSAYQLLFEVTKDQEYLKRAKENARRAATLGSGFGDVHLTLGQLAALSGETDVARKELEKALELDPSLFDAQLYLARLDEEQGRLEDARRRFEFAVTRRPGDWRSRSELAAFYYRHGRFADAEHEFRQILTLVPDDPGTYTNLGTVYMAMGRFEDAERTFDSQIRIKPSAIAYSSLGSCRMLLGKFTEAVAPMEIAMEMQPNDHELWRNFADACRFAPGQAARAAPAYRKALSLARTQLEGNHSDYETLASAALYDAHLGNSSEAIRFIRRASRNSPLNNEISFTASLVYEILGERVEALNALKTAYECGHPLEHIRREPELSELRSDVRYLVWLRQLESKSPGGNRNP